MSFDLSGILFIRVKLTLFTMLFDLFSLLDVVIWVAAKYFPVNKSVVLSSVCYDFPS